MLGALLPILLFLISSIDCSCFMESPWTTIRPLLQVVNPCPTIAACEEACLNKAECPAYAFAKGKCRLLGADSRISQICTPGAAKSSIRTAACDANPCGYLECVPPPSCADCSYPTCTWTSGTCPANTHFYAEGFGEGATLVCNPDVGWILDGSIVVTNNAKVYCVPNPTTTSTTLTTTTTVNLCGYLCCRCVPATCVGCVEPTTCSYYRIASPANFDIHADGFGTGTTLICDSSRGWILDGATVVANDATVNLCGYLCCRCVPASCVGCVEPTTYSFTSIACPVNLYIYADGFGKGATLVCDPQRGWVLDGATNNAACIACPEGHESHPSVPITINYNYSAHKYLYSPDWRR